MDSTGGGMVRLRVLRSNSGADGMNRQELIRDIKKEIGSFVSISQLAKYMGMSRDTVKAEILNGLEYYDAGKSKLYFAGDIADGILKHKAM